VGGRHTLMLGAVGILTFGCRRSDANPPNPDTLLPAVPPPVERPNVYAATGRGMISAVARRALSRVYVPNGGSASVSVIDPVTYSVVRTFPTGAVPQHVVPAYDLSVLWVANQDENSLTPIDPVTAEPGLPVSVDDPYNLYFTPDGRYAVVVAERHRRLDFRDPHTMALHDSVGVACAGVDHMEFTAEGRYAVASCEFSGQLLKLDVATHTVVGYLQLPADSFGHAMPQDVRSSPDGRVFYIADMTADGVHLLDPVSFTIIGFLHTGPGAHGIYPSRDGRLLYVTNRGSHTVRGGQHGPGSVSVLDPETRTIVATWPVPGGGSPDMGNVSADGTELWLSGRFDNEVYVFDTNTGALTHRIPVKWGPHGLTVWPQPGRHSLGHTGNMR
jgi:YVTN family beta-propeller protein